MCPRPKTQKQIDEEVQCLESLIVDVASVFNVDLELIKEGNSKGMCVLVCKIYYYIGKTKGDYSYAAMAMVAGRLNHTSSRHQFIKVKHFLKVKDPEFIVLWEHYLKNSNLFTKKDFK